jgi:CheY-like chemotaxis protein/nitrogen-specific signal transduction histidine kinase
MNQSLVLLQAWAGVWTLTCLALSAAMTERRRAEAELEEQKEAVELANRTKDHFLAMLSHELRTPLTPVMAAIDLLEMEPNGPDEFRENLRAIRRNIELEKRLIEDLLDVTRIASGKLKLELTTINAREAIQDVVEMCRSESGAKRLRLEIQQEAKATYIMADPAKFKQIIWNLLKNAIKFTPEGGTITISTTNDKQNLITTVRDTGIGIEPTQIGRIFDAFEQGDQAYQGRNSGLGLGLAISKAIAMGHGGSLEVFSEGRGRGATFRLTMATINTSLASVRREGVNHSTPEQHSWRILLVEDHADTSAVLRTLLSRRGHQVGVAQDVSSALAAARRESYDLVISDVGLPDGTGADLMSQLRESGLRGIAISGFGMSADVERSLAAGFTEHLVKPISLSELEAAIERAMQK